jgi:tetratricopeptide (TPR) repeat protein
MKGSTPMARPGRNDRCPCGSGKKYKACCLTRDEAAERERLAAEQAGRDERAEARRLEQRKERDAIAADFAASADLRDLDETVDAALRFVQEGKLEELETAARHILERYPDIPDGWEFLGHVHDKRGENRDAVACYRRVLEIINRTPDDFDPEYTQRFVDQIAKLDPPQAL